MMTPKRMVLVSTGILIDKNRNLLIAQRPEGKSLAGLWEFPGGKIEPGETPEHALCRELFEELNIEAQEQDLKPFTFISQDCDAFHLVMVLYTLTKWTGKLEGKEGQAFKWVTMSALEQHDMPKPDLPLLPRLRTYLESFS
ncbi:(deoxy)nucleoside triphosphate pyrophosphohydrolase [Acetobacteraceae bacterium ESL0709]|nr:(deoxy)nucleoside triphosphate pyrophosphohydrolase [Acetobacteraceae bacterium ESL0697]MDF7677715.1 (deoxy)nucleoside triphosphate pyrophosphohydrolase [Acetobacteraceae bacterium ESL0709]